MMSGSPATPEVLVLPVDRWRALLRGVWRLALTLLLAAPAYVMAVDLNWRLLRLNDRASFFGLGLLWLLMIAGALLLAISAVRWLLLACWQGPAEVRVTNRELILSLGPFGRRSYQWRFLAIRLYPEVDPELFDTLPQDAISITLQHRISGEDVGRKLHLFVRLPVAEIIRLSKQGQTGLTASAADP